MNTALLILVGWIALTQTASLALEIGKMLRQNAAEQAWKREWQG